MPWLLDGATLDVTGDERSQRETNSFIAGRKMKIEESMSSIHVDNGMPSDLLQTAIPWEMVEVIPRHGSSFSYSRRANPT